MCLATGVELAGEGFVPEPNQEITVQIQTDTPLWAMGLFIVVDGDAEITSAMSTADCNQYGWEPEWPTDPYVDNEEGWVYVSGVKWDGGVEGTIGYFKFIYKSGQVNVYIYKDDEWSCAFDDNCQSVPISDKTLVFGESDSNDFGGEGDSSAQNAIIDDNESVTIDLLSNYDLTLIEVHEYNTPVSYSDMTILATDSAYLIYDCNFTLVNCIMDINGSVEFNSDITLTNSKIRVKGDLKCKPGIQITETGASSIIATGDPQLAGKISLEGELNNSITIISDNVSGDTEFIIIDANSSANSSLKCIDFYGGWVNIQIYNKRLNNAISNCCFYGADYAIWQDGIEELTTVGFSLFCQNYISIYASIDGSSRTITYPLIDNVVIDGVPSESWGIILAGGQSLSYFDYFEITNSIITNCYCGWFIDAESFYPPNMLNLAYYGNDYDDNCGHPDFVRNPMYLTQSPFEEQQEPNDWPYYIDLNSPALSLT